jgi:hypothetical protein
MNTLQHYLAVRKVTASEIAQDLRINYHSVQKTIKGHRRPEHIMQAIAGYLGQPAGHLFGPGSKRHLRRLIAQEIDRCVESDRARLRRLYLRDTNSNIPNKRMAGNG